MVQQFNGVKMDLETLKTPGYLTQRTLRTQRNLRAKASFAEAIVDGIGHGVFIDFKGRPGRPYNIKETSPPQGEGH
jgi:hypothetical protein